MCLYTRILGNAQFAVRHFHTNSNVIELGRVSALQSSTTFVTTNCLTNVHKHAFSIAPMMDYTNRHQRYFQRLLTKHAILYTEMIVATTIVRAKVDPIKHYRADFTTEEPVVLQIGGSCPVEMTQAVQTLVNHGYREININCGCPSPKVAGSGCFGASLMLTPHTVKDMVTSLNTLYNPINNTHNNSHESLSSSGRPIVSTPITTTIKCRIGVDNNDSYEELHQFIQLLSECGVTHFIIHARKAILDKHFSPKDNRTIPPLRYEIVYRLVQDFPHIDFTLNGGVKTYEDANIHYTHGVKGVMIGRAAIDDSYYWRHIDSKIYGQQDRGLTRREIITLYGQYAVNQEILYGRKIRSMLVKPLQNLFTGVGNSKLYKRQLDRYSKEMDNLLEAFLRASECMSPTVLDEF